MAETIIHRVSERITIQEASTEATAILKALQSVKKDDTFILYLDKIQAYDSSLYQLIMATKKETEKKGSIFIASGEGLMQILHAVHVSEPDVTVFNTQGMKGSSK